MHTSNNISNNPSNNTEKKFVSLTITDTNVLLTALEEVTASGNRSEKEKTAYNKLQLISAAITYPCGIFIRLSHQDVQAILTIFAELIPDNELSTDETIAINKLRIIATLQEKHFSAAVAATQSEGTKKRIRTARANEPTIKQIKKVELSFEEQMMLAGETSPEEMDAILYDKQ